MRRERSPPAAAGSKAGAGGALPLSGAHSGLAEVSQRLREAVEEDVRPLLSFELGPGAVEEIARKLGDWLTLPRERRSDASAALSELARAEFGWEGVARGVVAAAHGRLAE